MADRPIKFVSVIELPAGDFVRKNGIVLLTAIGRENEDLMFEMISGAEQAQADALSELGLISFYIVKTQTPV